MKAWSKNCWSQFPVTDGCIWGVDGASVVGSGSGIEFVLWVGVLSPSIDEREKSETWDIDRDLEYGRCGRSMKLSVLLLEISGRSLGVLEDRDGGEAEPLWLRAFSFRRRPVREFGLIFASSIWNGSCKRGRMHTSLSLRYSILYPSP